jgi:hypothetical protein
MPNKTNTFTFLDLPLLIDFSRSLLCVHLLWLVLGIVALPIDEGLQPPQQELHEVLLELLYSILNFLNFGAVP